MVRLTAMAASSHHTPRHFLGHRSHSASSSVFCIDIAAPGRCGGSRSKRAGLAATSGCYGQEFAPQASPCVWWLLSYQCRGRLAICWGGRGGGARLEVEQAWDKDQGEDAGLLALEAELYDFMVKSSKPTHFPTTDELIAAGRKDLVEAIAEHGGWLAYGCGYDDDVAGIGDGDGGVGVASGDDEVTGRGYLQGGDSNAGGVSPIPMDAGLEHVAAAEEGITDSWLDSETLRQQREVEVGDQGGIKGILNRLEKERGFSYLEGENITFSAGKDHSSAAAADSGTFPHGDRHGVESFLNEMHIDDPLQQGKKDLRSGSTEPKLSGGNQEELKSRLQLLESELGSVLNSLRSRTDAIVIQKGQEGSLEDLHKHRDTLEFKETEIMNAQNKLRAMRAKVIAIEGKISMDIVEAQKILEEKLKRLDAAQQAMNFLRTVSVAWPYTASAVFLAGSFDGWTSQMLMEKTSTGIFSLYLKLYPGEYQIKFIVDGVWKVDPLRPTVCNDGYENNLLSIQ